MEVLRRGFSGNILTLRKFNITLIMGYLLIQSFPFFSLQDNITWMCDVTDEDNHLQALDNNLQKILQLDKKCQECDEVMDWKLDGPLQKSKLYRWFSYKNRHNGFVSRLAKMTRTMRNKRIPRMKPELPECVLDIQTGLTKSLFLKCLR